MPSTKTYQLDSGPLETRRDPRVLELSLLVGFSVVTAIVTLVTGTKPWFLPALFMGAIYLLLMFFGLEFGTYLILGAAVFFDQYLVHGIQSWYVSKSLRFYLNLNSLPNPVPAQLGGLHSMSQAVLGGLLVNPLELTMLLMLVIFIVRAAVSRKVNLKPVPNQGLAALFLIMLIFFTGYGLARPGGDWKVALWEIRPLYYLCLTYFLSIQTIRTSRQVRICVWIIILGLTFRGLQGCWRFFVTLDRDLGTLRVITGHEDSLFFVTGFLLLAAFLFLKYRGAEFYVLALSAVPCMIAFLLNQRRVTFGALGICMIALIALLPRKRLVESLRIVIPVAVLIAVYTLAFWKGSGLKAMPAQKIKSVFVAEEGSKDASSNFWREMELVNLKETVRRHPEGLGFGQKFLMVVPYASLEEVFPLWDYIPHCAIYWIWVKTGFVGFTIFWLFFGMSIIRTVIDYQAIASPYYKSLAMMVMLFIAGQLIVAYYDLQISYYRNMTYLGIAMGICTVLRELDTESTVEECAPQPSDALQGMVPNG